MKRGSDNCFQTGDSTCVAFRPLSGILETNGSAWSYLLGANKPKKTKNQNMSSWMPGTCRCSMSLHDTLCSKISESMGVNKTKEGMRNPENIPIGNRKETSSVRPSEHTTQHRAKSDTVQVKTLPNFHFPVFLPPPSPLF